MNTIQIFSTPIWESPYPDFSEHQDEFLSCVQNSETQIQKASQSQTLMVIRVP